MRLSVSILQFSPKVDESNNCGSASKFFINFVDLSTFFVTRYPLRQIESTSTEDLSDLLLGFHRFSGCFDWLEEVVHVEILPDSFDKMFLFFPVIFRHLIQRVICTSRRTLRPKTCCVYSYTSLLCSGSSRQWNRKHQLSSLGTATWRNIGFMLAESAIRCSRKQKIIPIRLCIRSVQIKVCRWGLQFGTLLLRCTLF